MFVCAIKINLQNVSLLYSLTAAGMFEIQHFSVIALQCKRSYLTFKWVVSDTCMVSLRQ